MNNAEIQLTVEQRFSIASFKTQVAQMSREQAQDFLIKLYEQMIVREATYQELLKFNWGLESKPDVQIE